jgi:ABC-type nitrate/sulfonate/bicarbonate transport system substrate-binding protein
LSNALSPRDAGQIALAKEAGVIGIVKRASGNGGSMTNEKVRLAIMAPSLNLCNYFFCIERGFFLREALDVEVMIRPGLRNTEAVARGEADFGAANECAIQTALQGSTELRILLQVLKDPVHDLIVGPAIQSFEHLRGQLIATPVAGSIPEIQTRLLLQEHGLFSDRDVFLVPRAPGEKMADHVRGLEAGAYSGLVAAPPILFLLENKGYRSLTELSSHFPGTASHGLVATTATIGERRPLVEAMVRGYARGITALKTDREAAVDFIARRYKLDLPLAVRCYDVLKDLWTAELSPDILRSEIAFQARNLGRSPIALENIADSQFAAIR